MTAGDSPWRAARGTIRSTLLIGYYMGRIRRPGEAVDDYRTPEGRCTVALAFVVSLVLFGLLFAVLTLAFRDSETVKHAVAHGVDTLVRAPHIAAEAAPEATIMASLLMAGRFVGQILLGVAEVSLIAFAVLQITRMAYDSITGDEAPEEAGGWFAVLGPVLDFAGLASLLVLFGLICAIAAQASAGWPQSTEGMLKHPHSIIFFFIVLLSIPGILAMIWAALAGHIYMIYWFARSWALPMTVVGPVYVFFIGLPAIAVFLSVVI